MFPKLFSSNKSSRNFVHFILKFAHEFQVFIFSLSKLLYVYFAIWVCISREKFSFTIASLAIVKCFAWKAWKNTFLLWISAWNYFVFARTTRTLLCKDTFHSMSLPCLWLSRVFSLCTLDKLTALLFKATNHLCISTNNCSECVKQIAQQLYNFNLTRISCKTV